MIPSILRSLLITVIIGLGFGGLMYFFIPEPISFYRGTIGGIVFQIIVYNIIRYFRSGMLRVRLKELEVEQLKQYDKQGMELQCAHCKHLTYVPVRFDQDNNFTCDACGENNAIYVNVTVARETTQLDLKSVTSKLIVDERDNAKKKLLDDE